MRGLMYTTWRQNYSLLPAFGDLLMEAAIRTSPALGDTASNPERASLP
jgi:hypothetical protein